MTHLLALIAILAAPILRLPESGQYRFHALAADPSDTTEICAVLDAGTANEIELGCASPDAAREVNFLVTVPNTPGVDHQIFGVSKDASGNSSAFSVDHYAIDFTAPGAPVLQ